MTGQKPTKELGQALARPDGGRCDALRGGRLATSLAENALPPNLAAGQRGIALDPTAIYSAGLFDGEGCVSVHRVRGKCREIRCRIKMCHYPTIRGLQSRWGGYVSYSPGAGRRRATWEWGVSGKEALYFILSIRRHCGEKRAQLFRAGCYPLGPFPRGVPADVENERSQIHSDLQAMKFKEWVR